MSVDKSELQITSADISAGQWCTPEFNKDIVTAAILIPKDCNSLDINFKVTNGATVYKDSKSDARSNSRSNPTGCKAVCSRIIVIGDFAGMFASLLCRGRG